MTKQEMQKRICCLEGDCKNLGTEISILKAELAEAEKPKLGHGDFGIGHGAFGRLTLKRLNGKMFSAGSGCCYDPDRGDKDHPRIIFGNIFNLMKDWGKNLTEFELDVHKYFIDEHAGMSHAPIHIAGNWHTEAEAYKFWCDFGQMLMTKKRKQT